MKAITSLLLLACVCISGIAQAQLMNRCTSDDVLTASQRQGRNAWARKCGYISTAKESMLNMDGEYQVFANGCFKYPCPPTASTCTQFVPASESAPCISGLYLLGTCSATTGLVQQASASTSSARGPQAAKEPRAAKSQQPLSSQPELQAYLCDCPLEPAMVSAETPQYICPTTCPSSYCGDGYCNWNTEDQWYCPEDCGYPSYCGDGVCNSATESELSCPSDCWCGDGTCGAGESTTTCSRDCGCTPVCGDGVCSGGESTTSCSTDCGTRCGDGVCNGGEATTNCPTDCGSICGDGYCRLSTERYTCPEDCGYMCIVEQCPLIP